MYPEYLRTAPLWPALGNHDARTASSITQSGVYYSIFTLPTRGQSGGVASGTEAYYAFDHANIHFVCLDSHDSDRSASGAMMQWLKADLANTTRDWIIAYFHHPTYTKGTHEIPGNPCFRWRSVHSIREVVSELCAMPSPATT